MNLTCNKTNKIIIKYTTIKNTSKADTSPIKITILISKVSSVLLAKRNYPTNKTRSGTPPSILNIRPITAALSNFNNRGNTSNKEGKGNNCNFPFKYFNIYNPYYISTTR